MALIRNQSAVFSALVILTLQSASALPVSADDVPRCFGQRATIVGTDGNDTLIGTDGPDVIVGLDGIDFISPGPGNDRVCLGPNPTLTPAGESGFEAIFEGDASDSGNDLLSGGSGSDLQARATTACMAVLVVTPC
jgi:Ca2+-binding RTX toxin-like protein